MSNEKLYEIFESYRKRNDITYSYIAEKLGTTTSVVYDKIIRLKKGQSVHTSFLFDLEKALKDKIFFK